MVQVTPLLYATAGLDGPEVTFGNGDVLDVVTDTVIATLPQATGIVVDSAGAWTVVVPETLPVHVTV